MHRRRDDGFHDIETCFYPLLTVRDALEIIPTTEFQFTQTGLPLDAIGSNLCVRAYDIMKKDFPDLPAVSMHLHKSIPSGAGLGGGSADASFTLQLLCKKFKLQVDEKQVADWALQLGSDCPFFLLNRPAIGKGRGELLEPVEMPLKGFKILLINPGIHIPTGWAFSALSTSVPETDLAVLLQQPVEQWRNTVINDFEKPVFENYPEIAALKEWFYGHDAVYASLSGTGSTVFGIFVDALPAIDDFPSHYRVFSSIL